MLGEPRGEATQHVGVSLHLVDELPECVHDGLRTIRGSREAGVFVDLNRDRTLPCGRCRRRGGARQRLEGLLWDSVARGAQRIGVCVQPFCLPCVFQLFSVGAKPVRGLSDATTM